VDMDRLSFILGCPTSAIHNITGGEGDEQIEKPHEHFEEHTQLKH
jgi:hypothetical protein